MSVERAFVDTNVLVYACDRDEPEKGQIARRLLEESEPGGLSLSVQVLSEFYVTVTRKLKRPLDASTAAKAVDFLGLLHVVSLDSSLVKTATHISRASQLSYWDSLIIAAAAAGGCERVFSEDLNHDQVIAGVRVENPFRSS